MHKFAISGKGGIILKESHFLSRTPPKYMLKIISIFHGCMVWIEKSVTPSDRFFYPHHTPMMDTFSCIPFDLPHLIFKEELALN